ncbi:MAG: hypothetical protein FJ272_11550, partial [Planctomycetes bacterium]|nr:hypothetical protein [Planctomycetota bacterium]
MALIGFAMVCLVFPAHTQAEQKPLWLSAAGQQPPRLYLFWQAGWTPKTKPEHVRLVSQNPPDLFQYPTHELSSGLPHGSMCPAPAEHKIRWSYEKDEPGAKPADAKPAWWTTEEYARRVADGADAVKWVMQQTGAHGLAPYVCAVKIEGERDKRLRFWAFYDRWDLYKQWFGPKPSSDPWDWVQFRPDYNAKSTWGFYKPADDGSRIHSGCPNSPFSAYLASLVKIGAQSGLRAVFVDNPGCNCVCPRCQAAWQDFLRRRFTKEDLKKCFDLADYADAKLTDKRFEIERKRFWGHS